MDGSGNLPFLYPSPGGGTVTPVTLSESLTKAARELSAAGSECARLDAEVLMGHVLGADRAWILSHPRQELSSADQERFNSLIERRSRGEPVAYLIGRRAWYDLDLLVTPDVLVPRPETEGLLERAMAWAGGRPVDRVADVGTGSGALAIALARALPNARIEAIDVSSAALEVARANASVAGVIDRIHMREGDLLGPIRGRLDLIVANLPYVGKAEYEDLARDVRLYEPRLALVGGSRGHELLARLIAQAPAYLEPNGALMAELGPRQADAAEATARAVFPRADVRLEHDYAGLIRFLLIFDAS